MQTSFYTEEELNEIGFARIGKNVLISRKASIYSPELIEIGNNVRIDDFCILSGKIKIGNYVHIAAGCYLFAGDAGIELNDFSGLSSRVTIYAVSDDYSGDFLTNPTVPEEYRHVIKEKVVLEKHVLIGSGSTILPGVFIDEGTAIGAMTLISRNIGSWKVVMGIPARIVSERNRKILEIEEEFMKNLFSNATQSL